MKIFAMVVAVCIKQRFVGGISKKSNNLGLAMMNHFYQQRQGWTREDQQQQVNTKIYEIVRKHQKVRAVSLILS